MSGSVQVCGAEAHPLWDLRAGRADDPAAELCRLHDELGAALRPAIAALPTRDDPLGEMVRRQMS